MNLPDGVSHFFDRLTDEYTAVIQRCFPRYHEMLWALIHYLPSLPDDMTIAELGCGTGNLSVVLAQRFPKATIHLNDISSQSLDQCRQRLPQESRFHIVEADMCDALVRLSGLDLIISNIAIHHLPSAAKRQLFSQAYASLRPGGVLAFADQLCGATDHIYQSHLQQWRRDSLAAGGTEEEWQMWMEHQRRHDHHDSLSNHLTWLHDLGFTNSDCIWRYLLWSVIQARR